MFRGVARPTRVPRASPPPGRAPAAGSVSYDPGVGKTEAGRPRPAPSSAQVSAQMKRMPRRDSKAELRLRRELHRLGLRYRVHLRGLPGTPDIAFTRARIAVFVDGCFWHGCPECYTRPKSNQEYWDKKRRANRDRDDRVNEKLRDMDWTPMRIWEHSLKNVKSARIQVSNVLCGGNIADTVKPAMRDLLNDRLLNA
mgnify:CR=1 FL=1